MGFVAGSAVLGQEIFPELMVSLSISFHQCSMLIFICMLLLQEGQTGATCEPSKSNDLSESGKPRLEECCHTCCEGRNSDLGTVA